MVNLNIRFGGSKQERTAETPVFPAIDVHKIQHVRFLNQNRHANSSSKIVFYLHTRRFSHVRFSMRNKRKLGSGKRRGLAAVEAAACMPVLILIWFGTVEVSRTLALKQQGQLIASTGAQRVVASSKAFSEIETELDALALSIGLVDTDITVRRIDSEVVESQVTIEIAKNSAFGSFLTTSHVVTSQYYSFRTE